jgi:hypothetical protein
MYRTNNGLSWEAVTTDAFGKADTVNELRSLRESFGKLWVTGYTDTSKSLGSPIWYSENGVDWYRSNVDGFSNPENDGQNAVVIGFKGKEYFAGPNYGAGAQVWRTVTSSGTEESQGGRILLYPNPIEDQLNLRFEGELTNFEVKIYDQLGRLRFSSQYESLTELQIDLSDFSEGTYHLHLCSDGELLSREKFMKF